MANPICFSPLSFYDSVNKQNHRKSYAYGHIVPLVMRMGVIDSFQFILPKGLGTSIGTCRLIRVLDGSYTDVKQSLIDSGLRVSNTQGFNVVYYPGNFPNPRIVHEGEYYLDIMVGGTHFISDVFCFTNALAGYLTLKYKNPEGYFYVKNGVIDLTSTEFVVRLKSEIGKPEYRFEEEATNRLGYSFVESQVSIKAYKFNAVIPEYLCDALRIVRLCSNKIIESEGETYDLTTFDMDVDWQEQGDLASVTCEFQIDNIVANLGGYSLSKLGGDFNADYNNDFNTY